MPAIGNDQPSSSNQTGSYATTALHALRLQTDNPAAGTVAAAALPTKTSIASIILSNFLPSDSYALPTVQPPSSQSLVVANSAEDLNNFHDVTFDFFDEDDDLFGSPLAFDASENGLWNGRFVPPPPRPPFFVDEPVLSDGLTTCDLCSWAMPTKSTFIFEGTIEKATELGWPLTLIIVSILSALLGAIIMITVVRCRRKKSSNNRNETHVQWWSRNKRPNNNNHLRRSNIYTAHPADSIRGLHQPTLSASSSLTAMTAMGAAAAAVATGEATTAAQAMATAGTSQQQQQQYYHQQQHLQQQFKPQQQHEYEYEHEYHQPQELQQQHHHQRQHSASISSASATSSPSLTTTITTMMPFQQQQQHDTNNWQHSAASMAVAS